MNKAKQDKTAFTTAYTSLNTAQKEAVDSIEGPVMVIAGPGTGKTQILTLRIANILLKTDTAPESILALTFTESGAKAMRERLRNYIGSEAYRIPIYTFHGFCGTLISDYPDAYADIIGGKIATEMDKIRLIQTILDGQDIKRLRPMGNPSYYVPHIMRIISTLKQEYITPEKFVAIINAQEQELSGIEKIHQKGAHKGKVRGEYTKMESTIEKNRELLFVYQQYEALLRQEKRYDYDDMIGKTIVALEKNEDMLRDLQEKYQYVLADEHQDVNGSQNRILELLTSYHDAPNIFVVGDEKQAIYRFQGASLENFLYFEDAYAGTKTIALTDNYRSGQTILDVAHSLVAVEDGPLKDLRVPLTAQAVDTSVVQVSNYSHVAVEHDDLVKKIQNTIASGTAPEEIAVIVRTNREVEVITQVLRSAGIVANPSADGDILSHPITHQIHNLIDAIIQPENESALFTVLHGSYWGISTADLVKLCASVSYSKSLTSLIADENALEAIGITDIPAITNVHATLAQARKLSASESPQRVLAKVLEDSGLLAFVSTHDGFESARVIRRMYDEIESLVNDDQTLTLTGVSQALQTYREHGLSLSAPYIASAHEAVQVMTAHKSKGLEFEVVFIPHMQDSAWGGKTRKTYFTIPLTRHVHDEYDQYDDERRLLYVALTRAKHEVILSYADNDTTGKALSVSRLLEELDASLLSEVSVADAEKNFSPNTALITNSSSFSIDPAVITKLLTERGFSATSLNNYINSPWDYFYRNVIRIPEVQPVHMQFGTAMHTVLEFVSKSHTQNGSTPTDTQLKQQLDMALERLPVSKEEYVRLHEKGLNALMSYVPQMVKGLPARTEEEKKIRVVLQTGLPEIPELPLTGMLDRLDFDEQGKLLRVVDYKTGKPKTRNAIEGKTASSEGGYKRQLVFYALLLSLYDDDRYQTKDCVLSFVEPDTKGVIHEEAFSITDEEIEELKQQIIAITQEIISGTFLQTPCDESKSSYCHLAQLLLEQH